eukprot:TRINITY_DN66840_c0_g1_i1.p1 TRINITY_DN66840_c0_g1~~TRINITY_DN66840_c0_g1_i1.p1  ORF type:complete len:333 (-),score=64.85 TRINITY_DN66840_c0_g1_i1:30-1028(-)
MPIEKVVAACVIALAVVYLLGATLVSFHMVKEGNVGIYYRFGRLVNTATDPGIHATVPLITRASQVYTRPQTDIVTQVDCATSDGLHLIFDKIDVGNTLPHENVLHTIQKYGEDYDVYLVKDKIRHQVAVICSTLGAHEIFITRFDEVDDQLFEFLKRENERLQSGLTIDFVRLTKPILPRSVAENYEAIATEKTKLKVEMERQSRLKKEAETTKEVALAGAEAKRRVAETENQMHLEKQQAQEELAEIENRIKLAKAKTEAEITRIRLEEEARAMRDLLAIPGYLELKIAEYLSANEKIYFGNSIPDAVLLPHISRAAEAIAEVAQKGSKE